MSIYINKKGKLVIEVESQNPIEELMNYRRSIYDLIGERNEDFMSPDPVFFGIELLRQLEPNEEQLKKALSRD